MSDSTDSAKCGFPPGTVVQYKDPYAEDRSYRAVFSWDEGAGTVDVKQSGVMHDQAPGEMETVSNDKVKVIGYCDAEGSSECA